MTVYLGSQGFLELKRDSAELAAKSSLDKSDVNVARRRFSIDGAEGSLITGDQVTIATSDKTALVLIKDHVNSKGEYHADWSGFIYIDDAGGIRLYDTFNESLQGGFERAVELVEPTTSKDITIKTRSSQFRGLASVKSFDFTTTREQVDITALGSEFKDQYEAGLISGQGSVDCFWSHASSCFDDCSDLSVEFPAYLARLCIRLQQGSDFMGRFFLYVGNDPEVDPSVWYEAECIVTNASVTVEPTQIISSSIDFVTTGQVRLHQGMPPAFMLQQDGDLLLTEDGDPIGLEDPN